MISPPRAVEANNYLDNPEILLKGKVNGPEHLLEKDGIFYASLGTGDVVKIVGEDVEVLSKFGKYCYEGDTIPHCGRPLGLAFDTIKEDTLIVMDSSTGIFELNVKTKKLKIILLASDSVGKENPRRSRILNSVAVAKNGDLYYTESTSDVEMDKLFQSFIQNPSGRLIHLDRKTKKTTVLIDRLFFANGVVLSPDEEFLVVSDLGRNKLVEYWLKTHKSETVGIFADSLPGCPDNIVADEKGIWVALAITTDPDNIVFFQRLSEYPTIRKFLARTVNLLDLFFKNLYSYTKIDLFKTLAMKVNSLGSYSFLFSKRATILRLDWAGKIIAAYHTYDGSMYTHVLELNGKLYLGSLVHDFIARVDRRDHS